MTDRVERYETREKAEAQIAKMGGWPTAEAVEYMFVDDEGRDLGGWAIAVPGEGQPVEQAERYVRESGLVG